MRTLVINATVVDGTGTALKPDSCVVIVDHLIEAVLDRPSVYYDRADHVIDARGGYLLPGLVNHHAHGLTRGPLMIAAQPPLSDARVQANLDRLLRQGVTTALNVDGFPTVEEAAASARFHPVAVKASTLHTPTHLAWASGEPFNFGGLTAEHLGWTVEKMLARGALVIGEAGPGIDAHWVDYALVPEAVRRFGGEVDTAAARALLGATERGEAEKVAALLRQAGVPEPDPAAFLGVVESIHEWSRLAGESLAEAVTSAERCGVPLVFHHTPGTYELLVEATERLGPNLIAAHSNFQATGPDEAVRRARAIKNLGGVVDIMSGDCFGSREFFDTPDVSFAMLAAGVVDLISTDYGGGFWDSMLVLIEEAARAGATTLAEGVRLVTSAPARAIAGLAPDRGVVAPGMVADLAITEPGALSRIRAVLIAGRPVELPRDEWA